MIVGYLYEKRKFSLLIADLLFWVLPGVPSVIFGYVMFIDVSLVGSFLISTKQVINSLLNTLLAMLIMQMCAIGQICPAQRPHTR